MGFKALVLLNAFSMGAVADFGLHHFSGIAIPPLFTIAWGTGAVFLTTLISTKSAQWHANTAVGPHPEPHEHDLDCLSAPAPRRTAQPSVNVNA
jgi:hypothetical protein